MNKSEDIFFDDWEDSLLDQLVQAEEFAVSSIATKQSSSNPFQPQQPPQPLPVSTMGFSPPRELSQSHRTATDFDSLHHPPPRPAKPTTSSASNSAPASRRPDSDKDLEIERLKRELGRASEQLANLEKECLELKKERDEKVDQPKFVCSKNEEENARTNCSKSVNNSINMSQEVITNEDHDDRDSGVIAPDYHNFSLNLQNGVPSKDLTVERAFKDKGVETDIVSHQEAQGSLNDVLSPYLDLSLKLLGVWGSPTDQKLGSNAISKLLVGCQRDFHILFGCMSMHPPSEITKELLTGSSRVALHYLKDCFCTPEATKVSHFYVALTKIADGTDVLETLAEPLVDLGGMENVVIVHSSLCILHALLKLLLESEKNFGRRLISGLGLITVIKTQESEISSQVCQTYPIIEYTLLRDNIFIEGPCVGKDDVDFCGLKDAKDGKLFDDEKLLSRKECWNHQSALQPHVNWLYLFEVMHQIAMRITVERVRVEAVSIMNLVLLRSNAYNEGEQFSQNIVFKTVSELLKKEAGLLVKKHALRLLYLVLNCPKLLLPFCCGCKEGDGSNAMDDDASTLEFQNFKIILQGLADCVASRGGGLLELKVSRNAILVLAFLASSGLPGFEILVGHRLSGGVNYLMLILQLLVSEMDREAGAYNELPEILRERTFLMREILILLNRLVSRPSYSATVLRGLTNTRDLAGLTIDVASRLSQRMRKIFQQDSMVKHIRETEIIDLARLFKKRVFTYLGDGL